jgi:diamine N-acetyltransferase
MIKILEATFNDYSVIQQLAHQIWPHTFKDILSKEQIDYMLEMMYSIPSLTEQAEKKGHRFILAKQNSNYTGYASYELNYLGSDKTKIHKIYILPDEQGKGTGKLLMGKIEEMAINAGNKILTLNVNIFNPAIQFYINIGFKKVGEENIPIGKGFLMEDIIMEKELGSFLSPRPVV